MTDYAAKNVEKDIKSRTVCNSSQFFHAIENANHTKRIILWKDCMKYIDHNYINATRGFLTSITLSQFVA